MCPYAIWQKDGSIICEPKKEQCTLCVMGNHKTFNEIENAKNEVDYGKINR